MQHILKNTIFIKLYILTGIILFYIPAIIYALPSNKIQGAYFHTNSGNEIFELYTIKKPQFNTTKLYHPNRIVFTIHNSFFPQVHQFKRVPGKKTNQFRISQNTKTQTRVVLDLAKDYDYTTKVTPLKNGEYLMQVVLPDHNSISRSIKPILITHPYISKPLTTALADSSSLDASIFDEDKILKKDKNTFKLSGSIQLRSSFDTDHDNHTENEISLKNRIILKSSYKNNFVLSGISEYLYFGKQNQTDDYDMDIYEAYLRQLTKNFDITIGKQIKRWGKTDQISPLDTLNPENITEFIIPTYEERKIPVWMTDLLFHRDSFFIEGVFIPFFEPAKFDYSGTDWAFFSQFPPALQSYFNSVNIHETKPSGGTDSFEYAMRAGGTLLHTDFAFTYHYATEDLPYFKTFPFAEYLRTHIFGFEFETTLSDLGIRGEAVWKENESFMTRSLTSIRNPTFSWIIGADYTSLNNWYFNLQFANQHIYQYDSSILFFRKNNYSMIGEINKDLLSDWLNASLQYTIMLNDNSFYFTPRLIYTYIRNLEIIFGFNIFDGSDNTILGRYDDNDQVFVDLKYHF